MAWEWRGKLCGHVLWYYTAGLCSRQGLGAAVGCGAQAFICTPQHNGLQIQTEAPKKSRCSMHLPLLSCRIPGGQFLAGRRPGVWSIGLTWLLLRSAYGSEAASMVRLCSKLFAVGRPCRVILPDKLWVLRSSQSCPAPVLHVEPGGRACTGPLKSSLFLRQRYHNSH